MFSRSFTSLIASAMLLISGMTDAQNTSILDRLYAKMSDSCLEMSYSYDTRISGVHNQGSGLLRSQGLMWEMNGNGVTMYCDSKSVWIIDPTMKEAVIEPLQEEESSQWISNPAVMLSRMKDMFKVAESLESQDGKAVVFVLEPLNKGYIDYCNLEIFKSGNSIRRATIALSDGNLIKIEVSSMTLTPKVSDEEFLPRMEFDPSWIVTDLR
ncbi:MAG: hypothetical protein E7116_00940 [Bacteroidales bacterium]|nr:hypothetical protein [Bacteroidales bacterium]